MTVNRVQPSGTRLRILCGVTATLVLGALICTAQNQLGPSSAQQFPSSDGRFFAVINSTKAAEATGESRVEVHERTGRIVGKRDYTSEDGEHGYGVAKAVWTPDSQFFVFSLESSGGHSPWHSPVQFFSVKRKKLFSLDDALGDAVMNPQFTISGPDRVTVELWFSKETRTVSLHEIGTSVSQEQTNFGVEDPFRRPEQLPRDALQLLRTSRADGDSVQECAEQEGIPSGEIPPSWFVASAIRLRQAPSSGLVVRGETGCLGGAHIAQFWVLEKSPSGYRIVFRGQGDGLEVLRTRTNGRRDLQLVIVTQAGANVDYVKFRYADGMYRVSGHRLDHAN